MIRNAIIAAGAIVLAAVASLAPAQTVDELYLEHDAIVDSVAAKKSRYLNADEANALKDLAKRLKDAAKADTPEPKPEPETPPPAPPSLAEAAGIVATMQPGEWRAVSKNTLLSVAPPREGHPAWGVMGPTGVTFYSGWALDTKRNILVINGGGHSDYGGDEVYHFSLETLSFVRVNDPSAYTLGANGMYSTGSEAPVSCHTYDGMAYLPNVDRVIRWGGSCWQSGSAYERNAYLWDPDTKTWTRKALAPVGDAGALEAGCDHVDGKFVCKVGNGLLFYDPITDTFRHDHRGDNAASGRAAAIDPVNRRIVAIGGAKAPLSYHGLDAGGRTAAPLTGNVEFSSRGHCGIDYAEGRFAIWCGDGDVWAVDASTFASTKYSTSGPTGTPPTGIWGRWSYVPALGVFVGWAKADGQVWFYKLPKPGEVVGDTTGQTGSPAATVAALKDGQTVDLPKGTFGEAIVITANDVTIRGYGTTLQRASAEGGVGTVIVRGRNVRIEGLTVRDAQGDATTGCFAVMAGSVTLYEVDAEGCPMGLRTGRGEISVRVERSRFGPTRAAGQLQHNWYVDQIASLTAIDTDIIGCASNGHSLKSRAKVNTITRGRIAQLDHACSRAIDLSQGGVNRIAGTIIESGRKTDNSDIMGFAREGNVTVPDGYFFPEWPGETIIDGVTVIIDWNNPAYVPGSHWAIMTAVTVGGPTHRAIVKNSRLIGPGAPWRAQWFTSVTGTRPGEDGGGNTFFENRAAAGMQPYPALN